MRMLKKERKFLYPIEGRGGYFVTRCGEVWSNKYHHWSNPEGNLIKKSFVQDKDGYLKVTLSREHSPRTASVHRLIAKTFIPNPEKKPTVNHKDGDKLNNSVDNLEWNTRREQSVHAFKLKLHPGFLVKDSKRGAAASALNRKRKIWQITLEGKKIKKHSSAADVENTLGFWASNIARCCRGKRKSAFGYRWEYADE